MNIIARNVTILKASMQFNESNTEITYQANVDLAVEGNPYLDLITTKTVFNLVCSSSDVADIQQITETQVDSWITTMYPPVQ